MRLNKNTNKKEEEMQIRVGFTINNPFNHYKPEEEKRIDGAKIREDKTMEGRFKRFIFRASESWDEASLDEKYRQVLQLIQGLEYSSKDITNFLTAIAEFQKMEGFDLKAGLFLSALINNCNENTFTICTSHLNVALHCIGYENTKHIVINGNVGDFIGRMMKGGSIIIKGNVRHGVGFGMGGGSITVNGNAGDDVGWLMNGGTITVNGNAGNGVGSEMRNDLSWLLLGKVMKSEIVDPEMRSGSIIINGNAGSFVGFDMRAGSIIIKGNVKHSLGLCMGGGSITVNGNAGNNVGWKMENGSIKVNSNAGQNVGRKMKGGNIYIGGNFSSLAPNIKGGNIFHKGKQIVKNGRRLI